MPIATLTAKGQVTIPKKVREALHWKAGDRLEFQITNDSRVTVEHSSGDLLNLRGLLHRPDRPSISVEEMNESIGRHLANELDKP